MSQDWSDGADYLDFSTILAVTLDHKSLFKIVFTNETQPCLMRKKTKHKTPRESDLNKLSPNEENAEAAR